MHVKTMYNISGMVLTVELHSVQWSSQLYTWWNTAYGHSLDFRYKKSEVW